MTSRARHSTARAYDAEEAAATEGDFDAAAAPDPVRSTVQDPAVAAPPVRRTADTPSNRSFGWMVGGGLVLLIALLAAVLFNAGLSVEVLP